MITRTHFRCLATEAEFGSERMFLIISFPEGEREFELESTEDTFPVFWTSEPVSLKTRETVEYWYISRSIISVERWRSIHKSLSPTGAALTVEDDEGLGRQTMSVMLPPSAAHAVAEDSYRTRLNTVRSMACKMSVSGNERVYVMSLSLPVQVTRLPPADGGGWEVRPGKTATIPALYQLQKLHALRAKQAATPDTGGKDGWPVLRQIYVGLCNRVLRRRIIDSIQVGIFISIPGNIDLCKGRIDRRGEINRGGNRRFNNGSSFAVKTEFQVHFH